MSRLKSKQDALQVEPDRRLVLAIQQEADWFSGEKLQTMKIQRAEACEGRWMMERDES
jgi:hypothetical protein